MKLLFITALMAVLAVPSLRAQEEALPEQSPETATPSDTGVDAAELDLIPETPVETQTPDFGPPDDLEAEAARIREKAAKPSTTQLHVQEQQQREAYRIAWIRAGKDPAVIEAAAQAEAARTFAEQRWALRLYYNRLCDRIVKLNPAVKTKAEEARDAVLGDLEQNRIRPSEWQPQ